jgi:2-isopropylmalate synthase
LPIDPKDIKRGYENVIRVNSQSGKGGVAFIISEFFGDDLDKQQAKEFGLLVKKNSDKVQRELSKEEIIGLYKGYKEK